MPLFGKKSGSKDKADKGSENAVKDAKKDQGGKVVSVEDKYDLKDILGT
jgi:hypothetical protein